MLADTIRPDKLSRTQETIDKLLTEHTEAAETLHSGYGIKIKSGETSHGFDAPATWTDDHHELAGLLKRYHGYAKAKAELEAKIRARIEGCTWATVEWKHDYWHLAQWYLVCRWARVPMMQRSKAGKMTQVVMQGVPQFTREPVRKGVEPPRVLLGVRWLDGAWEDSVRPRLGRGPQHIAWEKLLERKAA